MAILNSTIQFTGSLGNVSAYRMKGSDKIVLRTKGGASKQKIMESPNLELTRQNASEFGRCAQAAGGIRQVLHPLAHLADYNFTPSLTALAKKVQFLDTAGKRGERGIFISAHPFFFNGFNLNRVHPFDSIIRHPLQTQVQRSTGSASLQIPALVPGVNFFLPWPVPQYRFKVMLGIVVDQPFDPNGFKSIINRPTEEAATGWLPANQPFAGQAFQLQQTARTEKGHSYILAIGIEMEIPQLRGWGGMQKIGAAKIIEIV